MARLLVQLKVRLLFNALRASTGAKVAFILSTICAALVAGGVFYLLSILGGGIAAADLTTAIFCAFGLAWLIGPLVAFGLDGTLDSAPARSR
jgi:ABC-2 type transport system permease protein